MKSGIEKAMDSPRELEDLYRCNPTEFERLFDEVVSEHPDSIILQVWRERLHFDRDPHPASATTVWSGKDLVLVILLSLIAGTFARVPRFMSGLRPYEPSFYPRFLPLIVIAPIAVFLWVNNRLSARYVAVLGGCFALGGTYLGLLPVERASDSVILAYLHFPVVYWSLLGISFLGKSWRECKSRMEYLRYNGELLIYTAMILIGGVILTSLSLTLFSLTGISAETWYFENVVVYGAIAAPLVATFLVIRSIGPRLKLASILAKVFIPLFLVTVAAFLIAMVALNKSPFHDRDSLMGYNSLLLVVLGLAVFSISGRAPEQPRSASDIMNLALVTITLLLDIAALAAILGRVTSYGFSPNRIAVLGMNVLVFGHLLGIFANYLGFIRGHRIFEQLERWITGYLPVYTAWSALVGLGFPFLFGMR